MERPHAVEFINALECDADLDQIQLILDAIDDIQYIAISVSIIVLFFVLRAHY
jgi:hypothetical protein